MHTAESKNFFYCQSGNVMLLAVFACAGRLGKIRWGPCFQASIASEEPHAGPL